MSSTVPFVLKIIILLFLGLLAKESSFVCFCLFDISNNGNSWVLSIENPVTFLLSKGEQ